MKQRLLTILPVVVIAAIAALLWMVLFGGDATPGEDVEPEGDEETAALSGQVVDEAGRGVGSARVFAEEAMTRTDAEGHFSFAELPAESVRIDATAQGHRRAGVDDLGRPVVDLEDEESVEGLELTMPRAASISGRVVAGGEPVGGADISLSYVFAEGLDGEELEPFIVSKEATSGEEGAFVLDEIAPGRLQILVESDDHPFTESEDLYLRAGQDRDDVVVDLAPSGGLRGEVVGPEGQPVEARISVNPADPQAPLRTVEADEGSFSIRDLNEGDYAVMVEAEGYQDETIEGLEIEVDEVTELDVELTEARGLYGRVVDTDGEPVSDAHVVIRDGDDGRRIRVDDDGSFEWADVDDGDWEGSASAPGHQPSETRPMELDDEIVFELTAGGFIDGRVVGVDGQPVSRFDVDIASMEMEQGPGYHPRQMPTEEIAGADEGSFEFGPLQTGRYRIRVTTDEGTPAVTDPIEVEAGARSGPVVVQLEKGGAIRGVVRDEASGEPLAGAEVRYVMSTPDGRPPRTRTDGRGRYELEDLPSGRSSLRVAHGHYIHEIIGGLHVPDGGELTYDIDLEPLEEGDQPGQIMQGIGATLSSVDDGFRVEGLSDEAAARRAGVEGEDVITGVDGESVEEMTVDQVVELIRGEPGTDVSLEVSRPGRGTRSIDIEREEVFIPQNRDVRPRE